MTVDEVSLEYCPNCAYDSVSLYDGSTESSTVLKKLCSTTSDSTTSSGSTVLVVFKSDSSESTGRFKLNWEFVGGDACGGEPERLSESSGTIQSPGYDSSTYPNDANCQWIIEAPAGKVRLMSTQSVYYYSFVKTCLLQSDKPTLTWSDFNKY